MSQAHTTSDRDPGSEDREHGRRAGTDQGEATHHTDVIGRVEPSAKRPGASIVHEDETTKIVSFEFSEGQELPEGVLGWTRRAKRMQQALIEGWIAADGQPVAAAPVDKAGQP